jgi:hypothetical protein
MKQRKRRRWPVRWTETEENLIEEGSKLKGIRPTQFVRDASINKAISIQKKTGEAPQTNEQKLKRKIFDYKIKEGWVETANGLQEVAEILKSSRSKYSNLADIIWHELMIWGFCLENLLKGLYSKKQAAGLLKNKQAKPLNRDGELSPTKRDHDLKKWCQRAELTNFTSTEQVRILRNLTQIITHHGRYPVSSRWSNSESVYWGGDQYDHILMQMISFLKQEIERIKEKNA